MFGIHQPFVPLLGFRLWPNADRCLVNRGPAPRVIMKVMFRIHQSFVPLLGFRLWPNADRCLVNRGPAPRVIMNFMFGIHQSFVPLLGFRSWPNAAATPRAFRAENYLWRSDCLTKLLVWSAVPTSLLPPFPGFWSCRACRWRLTRLSEARTSIPEHAQKHAGFVRV